jgi:outer membrane biogenesis lipoprotein LolB
MDGFARMRLFAALLTFCCLSACAMTPSTSQADQADYNDGWRTHQATLDADAIMQGMARAREQASQMARSSR